VVSLGGLSYLAGLKIYGAHEEHPERANVGLMASTVHVKTSLPTSQWPRSKREVSDRLMWPEMCGPMTARTSRLIL
jgi:hypothetical protein